MHSGNRIFKLMSKFKIKLKPKALLFILIILPVCIAVWAHLFDPAENIWLDFITKINCRLPGKNTPGESPVILIDCPYYKSDYNNILNNIAGGNPKAIVFTFMPSNLRSTETSKEKLILPVMISQGSGKTEILRRPPEISKYKKLGYINLTQKQPVRDATIYDKDTLFNNIFVETLSLYYSEKPLIKARCLSFGEIRKIPLGKSNLMHINYQSQPGKNKKSAAFEYYTAEEAAEPGKNKKFTDKIVIMGATNPINGNYQQTPVGFMSQSEILAQTIYSVTENKTLKRLSPAVYCILILLAFFMAKLAYSKLKLQRKLTRLILIVIAIYLFLSLTIYLAASIYLEIIPFLIVLLVIALTNIYLTHDEKQQLIKENVKIFSPIIEKAIADSDADDWGESMLALICKPLDIHRGILLISREQAEDNKTLFYYPSDTYKASKEEIEELQGLKEPALGKMTLAIPLIREDNTYYGTLKLQKKKYGALELKQLAALSKIAMISINNRRLVEKLKNSHRLEVEAELAGKIQQALLTEAPPPVKGADIACRCIPASEVGGDYFDFFRTPKGSIGIACGDVTGHGMAAALIMGLLRSVVRSQGSNLNSAAEVVSSTNNTLYKDFVSFSKMASLFYCTYSPVDKTLIFTNAGHNPPLLIRSYEMESRQLKGKGPILGFRPNIKYKEFRIKTYPKDIIIFMTDGIVEAENANHEFFGLERVEKVVNNNVDYSAQDILDAVFAEVMSFTQGQQQKDDMTLIIMKV